jgi:tetratricopeptide (TPR) repeat protein
MCFWFTATMENRCSFSKNQKHITTNKPMKNQILTVLIAAVISINFACSKSPNVVSETVIASENSKDSAKNYNRIAADFIRKARETGDFSLNTKAENAVAKAIEIEPENFDSIKLKASLHLTFHRFAEALELGTKLDKENPNNAFVYGILTDANVELGNYAEAIKFAQKMVDLKPNMSSYTRVAYLRSLHGDSVGAVESYKMAAKIADPQDFEAQAWCNVHLGDEFYKIGKFTEAEKSYDTALQIFPNYAAAYVGKAKVRAVNNDNETAIRFFTEAQNRVPLIETVILLGDVYAKTGNADKAKQQYDLAEVIEQKFGTTDQRRIAQMWADNDVKLPEALEITEREHATRKDIFTADIYAWCLYKNGNLIEAKNVIAEAMRLKTNDARFYYHAGMIEKDLGNKKDAKRLLELALKINPSFDFIQAEKAKLFIH